MGSGLFRSGGSTLLERYLPSDYHSCSVIWHIRDFLMHYISCFAGQEGRNLVLGWQRWRRYCPSFVLGENDHLALVANYHVCNLDISRVLRFCRGYIIIWMLVFVFPDWSYLEIIVLRVVLCGRWTWRLWQIERKRTCLSSKFVNDLYIPYSLHVSWKWKYCRGFSLYSRFGNATFWGLIVPVRRVISCTS